MRERRNDSGGIREFIVFVDNLSSSIDVHEIQAIFRKVCKASNIYILFKVGRRTERKFGFVRFWGEDEVARSIVKFNNFNIRWRRIRVYFPRFEKYQQNQGIPTRSMVIRTERKEGLEKKTREEPRKSLATRNQVEESLEEKTRALLLCKGKDDPSAEERHKDDPWRNQ